MTTFEPGFGSVAIPPPGSVSMEQFLPKRVPSILAALTALSTAVFGLLTSFEVGHWTAPQITLVGTELATFWACVTAVVSHCAASTRRQPVAVAGTVTALVTTTVSLGVGFRWWQVTDAQNAALTGMLTAIIAVAGALIVRTRVIPLSGSELSGSELSGSNLSGSDLSGPSLSGPSLSGPDRT